MKMNKKEIIIFKKKQIMFYLVVMKLKQDMNNINKILI